MKGRILENYSIGISLGHDTGVAVIHGDELIFAVNEERLSRIKSHCGIPLNSISSLDPQVFRNSQIFLDGKIVAPHGNSAIYTFDSELSRLALAAQKLGLSSLLLGSKLGVNLILQIFRLLDFQDRKSQIRLIESLTKNKNIKRVDHHSAHVLSVIRQGVFSGEVSSGTFLTLDAMGEAVCSKFGTFNSRNYQIMDWQPALASPATLYAYLTKVIGFTPLKHEGKLTGLASRGNPSKVEEILSQYYSLQNGRFKVRGLGYGIPAIQKLRRELQNIAREDIAAGLQSTFEKLILGYLDYQHSRGVPLSNLFLAGGAFANVKLNYEIAKLPYVERLRVAPNMGDGGLALGLAASGINNTVKYSNLYLGTSVKSPTARNTGLNEIQTSNNAIFLARALLDNKFIAIANHQMEWGPRALGNRSILFSADSPDLTAILNAKLRRSEFMPFAPIVRYEDAHKYFIFDSHIDDYLFMTIACQVKNRTRVEYPGIVHVDGTARPQILRASDNPFLHRVLSRATEIGGKEVFVNTSFNLHEEPIVATSDEATSSFKRAKLDYLVLNERVFAL